MSAASWVRSASACSSRRSAGTRSPWATATTSPGTTCSAWSLDPLAIPAHACRLLHELGQRGDRAAGAKLLGEADQRVEHHDGQDHQPVLQLAEGDGHRGGDQQRAHQRAAQLAEQERRRRRPGYPRQAVGPVALQPRACLLGAEAVLLHLQARQHRLGRIRMPGDGRLGPLPGGHRPDAIRRGLRAPVEAELVSEP